jgi:hypothetical protein
MLEMSLWKLTKGRDRQGAVETNSKIATPAAPGSMLWILKIKP